MKRILIYCSVFIGVLIIGACHSDELSPKSYLKWVNDTDNGLIVKTSTPEYELLLQFKPSAYMAYLDIGGDALDQKIWKEQLLAYEPLEYYTLKLKKATASSLASQAKKKGKTSDEVNYYAFDFEKDLKLIIGIDTLNPQLFHFERSYGLVPYMTFSMAFDVSNGQSENRKFLINDQTLMDSPVELQIKAAAINKIPKLKL